MQLRENTVNKRSRILEASFAAVERRLESMWARRVLDPKLTVFFSHSYEVRKSLDMVRNRMKDESFDLPVLTCVPAIWARPDSNAYNAFALQRQGVSLGRTSDRRSEIREKLVPIEIGIGTRFITRNAEEARMWATILIEQQLNSRINIKNNETGGRVAVTIAFESQATMPEAQFGSDEKGDLINLDTNIILKTYGGEQEFNALTKRIQLGWYQPQSEGWDIELDADRRPANVITLSETQL